MPRPNPGRVVGAEDNLAERIRLERESRGWSYEVTANALTDAGCPMQGSAVHKIEKVAGRRRITVDELVAFARVFDLTVEELLRTGDEVREAHRRALIDAYAAAVRDFMTAQQRVSDTRDALRALDDDADAAAVIHADHGVVVFSWSDDDLSSATDT